MPEKYVTRRIESQDVRQILFLYLLSLLLLLSLSLLLLLLLLLPSRISYSVPTNIF
jgi:hypothetical protein